MNKEYGGNGLYHLRRYFLYLGKNPKTDFKICAFVETFASLAVGYYSYRLQKISSAPNVLARIRLVFSRVFVFFIGFILCVSKGFRFAGCRLLQHARKGCILRHLYIAALLQTFGSTDGSLR
ncbi:MAG: hypothetical protein IIW63_00520 [Clostridia bacterium]|nr:hypothetical protein [Clostridia bacterium]